MQNAPMVMTKKNILKMTNLLSGATSPQPIQAPQGRRVKVVGPNGQRGTILEGDKLPTGWSIVQ